MSSFTSRGFYLCHPHVLINRIRCKINRRKQVQFFEPTVYNISAEREERLLAYEKNNYRPISVTHISDWKKLKQRKTTFVVGSDIIWQPSFGPPGYYFLDFAYKSGMKKYSYATSIGANELPESYNKYYKRYLDDFNGISVREQKAADMLNKIIDKKAVQMIDPTLLHRPDFWDNYASKADISDELKTEKFIFCYFVMDDDRYWKYVKKIVDVTGYKVAVLPMHTMDEEQPYNIIKNGTPYEFLWLIKNSELICTDSFHVCAFSLNYKKEFYLLRRSRKDEDAKYDDFFKRYGLENRSIKDESVFVRNTEIDYETAHKKLEMDRQKAYTYIDSMIQ